MRLLGILALLLCPAVLAFRFSDITRGCSTDGIFSLEASPHSDIITNSAFTFRFCVPFDSPQNLGHRYFHLRLAKLVYSPSKKQAASLVFVDPPVSIYPINSQEKVKPSKVPNPKKPRLKFLRDWLPQTMRIPFSESTVYVPCSKGAEKFHRKLSCYAAQIKIDGTIEPGQYLIYIQDYGKTIYKDDVLYTISAGKSIEEADSLQNIQFSKDNKCTYTSTETCRRFFAFYKIDTSIATSKLPSRIVDFAVGLVDDAFVLGKKVSMPFSALLTNINYASYFLVVVDFRISTFVMQLTLECTAENLEHNGQFECWHKTPNGASIFITGQEWKSTENLAIRGMMKIQLPQTLPSSHNNFFRTSNLKCVATISSIHDVVTDTATFVRDIAVRRPVLPTEKPVIRAYPKGYEDALKFHKIMYNANMTVDLWNKDANSEISVPGREAPLRMNQERGDYTIRWFVFHVRGEACASGERSLDAQYSNERGWYYTFPFSVTGIELSSCHYAAMDMYDFQISIDLILADGAAKRIFQTPFYHFEVAMTEQPNKTFKPRKRSRS